MRLHSFERQRSEMGPQETDEKDKGVVDELTNEIRRVIEDNRKFLERVLADDFDDDELSEDEPEVIEEEL